MNERNAPARPKDAGPSSHIDASWLSWAWPPRITGSSEIFRDVIAGFLAAVVLIGNIISFGGLMFPGDLTAGIPTVIWAMLISGAIGGVWIALATSLMPHSPWCQEQLLGKAGLDTYTGVASFEPWLRRQLGSSIE
jgi:hypothetical protein